MAYAGPGIVTGRFLTKTESGGVLLVDGMHHLPAPGPPRTETECTTPTSTSPRVSSSRCGVSGA
jgi:hypothetical protein